MDGLAALPAALQTFVLGQVLVQPGEPRKSLVRRAERARRPASLPADNSGHGFPGAPSQDHAFRGVGAFAQALVRAAVSAAPSGLKLRSGKVKTLEDFDFQSAQHLASRDHFGNFVR